MADPGSHSTFHQQSLDSYPRATATSMPIDLYRDWSLPGSQLQTEARPRGPGCSQIGPPTFPDTCSLTRLCNSAQPGSTQEPRLFQQCTSDPIFSTPTLAFSLPSQRFQGLCALSRTTSCLLPDQYPLGYPVSSSSLSLNETPPPPPTRSTIPPETSHSSAGDFAVPALCTHKSLFDVFYSN